MSTRTLLDKLVARASSGWNRSTGKRNLLAEVQNGRDALINSLGEDRLFRGTDNKGFPPYLKTVAGTYDYDITPENLSSGAIDITIGGTKYSFVADIVRRLFVDVTEGGYDSTITWMSKPFLYADFNPYSLNTERLVISEVAVSSRPSLGSAAPSVTFPVDPGTENTKYFCEFYYKAPPLISESIPLMIPEEFEKALEDYVIGYIQECENGSPSNLFIRFEQYWKPEFKKKFHRTARLNNNRVIPRPM
jgi:hypothetical protein